MVPACVNLQQSDPVSSVLTVEATPAAAPQSFTALVVASNGNWSRSVPLDITVESAIPAWIPWSIILAFVAILTIPLALEFKKTRLPRQSSLRSVPTRIDEPGDAAVDDRLIIAPVDLEQLGEDVRRPLSESVKLIYPNPPANVGFHIALPGR